MRALTAPTIPGWYIAKRITLESRHASPVDYEPEFVDVTEDEPGNLYCWVNSYDGPFEVRDFQPQWYGPLDIYKVASLPDEQVAP